MNFLPCPFCGSNDLLAGNDWPGHVLGGYVHCRQCGGHISRTRARGDAAVSAWNNRCLYQFPTTKFVTNSPWRQWWHLVSEVIEIARALIRGDLQHAAAEAWDVKQSTETLHRILAGRGADIELARKEIVDNNIERGYYHVQ